MLTYLFYRLAHKVCDVDSINKAASIACVSFAADVLSQKCIEKTPLNLLDLPRACKYAIFRFFISFVNDAWNRLTDKFLPRRSIYRRILLDQFIFDPFCYLLYYLYLAIVNFQSLQQLKLTLRTEWAPAVTTSMKFWPLIQFINYTTIPKKFDDIYCNVMSFVYDIYLVYQEENNKRIK